MGGLEDSGGELGDGRAGGDDDGGQRSASREADREKTGSSFVEDGARVPAEGTRFEGVGEGRAARTGAVQDVGDAQGVQGGQDRACGIDGGHAPSLPGACLQVLGHTFEAHPPPGREVGVAGGPIDEFLVGFEASHG